MTYPSMPPGVVSGELIESAWGNLVAEALAATDQLRGGTTPGGVVAPGAQAPIASISLPQGAWNVFYQVLINGAADWKAAVRAYVGGAFASDVIVQGHWDGTDAGHSAVMNVFADFTTAPGGGTVGFNLINNSTVPLATYADPANHRIHAMQGRLP